jgi:hypothetical protein
VDGQHSLAQVCVVPAKSFETPVKMAPVSEVLVPSLTGSDGPAVAECVQVAAEPFSTHLTVPAVGLPDASAAAPKPS